MIKFFYSDNLEKYLKNSFSAKINLLDNNRRIDNFRELFIDVVLLLFLNIIFL